LIVLNLDTTLESTLANELEQVIGLLTGREQRPMDV